MAFLFGKVHSFCKTVNLDGTTAICSTVVKVNKASDKVKLEMRLWEGTKCIKTWDNEGVGNMIFKKSKIVTKGKTYKLTADISINGIKYPTISVSETCK